MRLQRGFAWRSFARMRVEAVGEIPRRVGGAGVAAGDAAAGLAIKNFLAAIESEDSLFCVAQPLAGPAAAESMGGRVYSGEIVLEFRDAEYGCNRSLHFLLMEKLTELLKEAGSAEFLETALCLTAGSISDDNSAVALTGSSGSVEKPKQEELALWLRLAARGDSAEQAVLRWGLGLAHVQQALLFSSRYLRLYLAQKGR